MEIRRLLYSIIHKWWLILFFVIISGGIGYYLNIFSNQPMYGADTTLFVLNREKVEAGQALSSQDLVFGQELVKQYSEIFYSRSVISETSNKLAEYNISPEMLASMVTISSQKDSNILTVHAVSFDPEVAAITANAMAEEFTAMIRDLTKSDYISILDQAQVAQYPMPNNGVQKTFIWLMAGLVIACGIIYIIEYLNTTVRSAEEIESQLSLRVIGIIPEHDIR
ncbi:lipopolysaccharide biosynthesis protein [Syntrophobotulus glycolicus DSM 8271]|uniref:Lipopolysaccharide biosynthesis protein n=1 Tax=Syntrophobotulus glycolicus (strain DSM 8271 / FlGlyR) TaxID=645991 RepID=F0SY77_SYNGF|nr:Wzz/FepE/Etk N-terminal domain-containing protein [Syntrophobotulus glycolicus]ADY55912.1 lipopolysaccharide biosynthesis protein [Syntrophobotulus glycolicus DSM 8271]